MTRLLVLAAAFALALPSVAQAKTVKVYFTLGEQIAAVKRSLPAGPTPALAALMAGPTAKERAAGYGTAIPAPMKLAKARVVGDTVELTLSGGLAGAGLAQVVYT